jgi:D-tyrosyl-tRNA(Tyr) deacylase
VRAVVQRVSGAAVRVDGATVGEIGAGVLVLVGVHANDAEADAVQVADKVANLRIFADDEGKMNRSVLECGGSALVVSQFTLYGDTRKGRRPSFVEAAAPELAEPLVRAVGARLEELGVPTSSGQFGAHMDVELTNDGPVTILVET